MSIEAVRPKKKTSKTHIRTGANDYTLCGQIITAKWEYCWPSEDDITITCKICVEYVSIILPQKMWYDLWQRKFHHDPQK